MTVMKHIGSNQVPGGACPDQFHFTAADIGFEISAPRPQRYSTCPTCAAIMMPGAAVTPEFFAEYKRRLASKICLANRGGRFVHDRKASQRALAGGACLCKIHDR
jgi:hypothetical protein